MRQPIALGICGCQGESFLRPCSFHRAAPEGSAMVKRQSCVPSDRPDTLAHVLERRICLRVHCRRSADVMARIA